jgi:hypothetical protein
MQLYNGHDYNLVDGDDGCCLTSPFIADMRGKYAKRNGMVLLARVSEDKENKKEGL